MGKCGEREKKGMRKGGASKKTRWMAEASQSIKLEVNGTRK